MASARLARSSWSVSHEEEDKFPTVAGLCLALDLTREGLLTYQGREEFSDTIKRAKMIVGEAVEQVLMSGKAPAGAIFNLKNNFGWKDQTEQNVNMHGNFYVSDESTIDEVDEGFAVGSPVRTDSHE